MSKPPLPVGASSSRPSAATRSNTRFDTPPGGATPSAERHPTPQPTLDGAQPFWSLRIVIGSINAVIVALVTMIILLITWTVSIDALRTIGKSHASALADVIEAQVEVYMQVHDTVAETLRNVTLGLADNYAIDRAGGVLTPQTPAIDVPNVSSCDWIYEYYRSTSRSVFLATGMRTNIHTFFLDGTRISFMHSSGFRASYIQQNQRLMPSGELRPEFAWYWRHNHSAVPADHWAYREDFTPPADVRESGLLRVLMQGTFQGTLTLYNNPTVVLLSSGLMPIYSTLVTALKMSNGTVYGFTMTSLELGRLDTFLRELRGTPNTYTFAVDGVSRLLASSHPTPHSVSKTIPATGVPEPGCMIELTSFLSVPRNDSSNATTRTVLCRKSALEFPYPPLQRVAADPDFLLYPGRTVRLVKLDSNDGGTFYVASHDVPLKYTGMRVQLIVTMPEEDIIGSVVEGRNLAIGVAFGVLVIVATVSIIAIRVLLTPLDDIALRMQKAASLRDSDEMEDVSKLSELYTLQVAYYSMNSELNRIRSFVPQSLLQRQADRDDGDDGADDDGSRALLASSQRSADGSSVYRPDASTTSSMKRPDWDTGSVVPDRDDRDSVSSASTGTRGSKRVTFARDAGRATAARPPHAATSSSSLATSVSLHTGHVTVVAINLAGFHSTCRGLSPDELSRKLTATGQFVHETAVRYRGVLDHCNGDQFLVTFNAVRPCPHHTRRGALMAHAIASCFAKARAADETSSPTTESPVSADPSSLVDGDDVPDDVLRLIPRIGLASGRAYVGHIGTDKMMSFNVVGSPVTHAVALRSLAKLYRRKSVVVPQRTFNDLLSEFDVRALDVVTLPGGALPTVVGELTRRCCDDHEDPPQVSSAAAAAAAALEPSEEEAVALAAQRQHQLLSGKGGRRKARSSRLKAIDGNVEWLFARSESNDCASNWCTMRMKVFAAVAGGLLQTAEPIFAAMLDELSHKNHLAAAESSFNSERGGSDILASTRSSAAASAPLGDLSTGSSGAFTPPLVLLENALAKLETLQFLELSDAAPGLLQCGPSSDSPAMLSLPLVTQERAPPLGGAAAQADRVAAPVKRGGPADDALPGSIETKPSATEDDVDPRRHQEGPSAGNATWSPSTIPVSSPSATSRTPGAGQHSTPTPPSTSSGHLQHRPYHEVAAVAFTIAPRVPTIVSLMHAARAGQIGQGLGVYWDSVVVGLDASAAAHHVPPGQLPPGREATRCGRHGSISLADTSLHHLANRSLPPSAMNEE